MPIYVPGKVVLAKQFTWNETVWNPSMITTALWLDAADATTVTASGGAVSEWRDKSGNTRHVTQVTTARQPSYVSNSIVFVDDSLANALLNWGSSSSSVFLVMNESAGSTGFQNIITTGAGAAGQWGYGITADGGITSNKLGIFNILQNFFSFTATASTSSFLACFTSNGVSSGSVTASLFLNGTADASNPATATSTTSAAGIVIGSNATFTEPLKGAIYEIVMLPSVADTTTRQRIEGYLAWKWGLTANLPSDHPYKTVGPTP
jgi:hypothetical protein